MGNGFGVLRVLAFTRFRHQITAALKMKDMSFVPVRKVVRNGRRIEFVWRYLFNFRPAVSYKLTGASLSGEACRVLRDLNRHGIAITSVERLLGYTDVFQKLLSEVDEIERRLDFFGGARENVDQGELGKKTFLVELLGKYPRFDANSVYAHFALQYPIVEIADAYFGMYTKLRYYNVWHTLRTTGEARESQLWHRDREDFLVLKLFAYLSDVDEGAGPFTYAPGTHAKGPLQSDASSFVEAGVKRSNDIEIGKVVDPKRWITAAGARGTIVFADTRGYHKGGLSRTSDRVVYTCMFTSPASESKELFDRRGLDGDSSD
jgi:hypothetical protein